MLLWSTFFMKLIAGERENENENNKIFNVKTTSPSWWGPTEVLPYTCSAATKEDFLSYYEHKFCDFQFPTY